ncbi:ABC-type enterobactin transport system permease subunit [Arthrobacter sp. B2I5]|uniref:hypothetical protein n=1 Tax=Arthrobacter sp. B2I5 TaxID=3042266 RepID=UPI0027898F4B|nr:hypothetical protein [Arthrobacter sp. B2I5]MDQ0828118.1 ABC-type enterobactin transport system permease subunit [Arthrobacter sp. B2I5]
MISDIISGLDKKFEGRINAFYTFTASALAIVAIISVGKPPLTVLSTVSSGYLGASIPWFEAGQAWVSARDWLTPGICTALVVLAAVAVVLQGRKALQSRSSATLWLIAALAVSRGTDMLVITLAISVVLTCGGLIRQRIDESGLVPATAATLGLIAAPVRLVEWLCGLILNEDEVQEVRTAELEKPLPSGARIVR